MNQYTLIARKNIEKQYDSECTIYELKPKVINNITKDVETEVFKNKKCRISFEDIYVNTQTDTEAKKVQKISQEQRETIKYCLLYTSDAADEL